MVAVVALSRMARSPSGGSRAPAPGDAVPGVPGVEEPAEPSESPAPRRETLQRDAAGERSARTREDDLRAAAAPAAEETKSDPPAAAMLDPDPPKPAAPSGRDRAAEAAAGRPAGGLPKVAIVLDDCGQRLDLMERAVRLRQPLTFAVIPHLPHSRASAEAAHSAGHEVIVHQPMEPEGGEADPGEGVLMTGMSRRDVQRILKASFASVPHARGLNNHMGSRATADAELMGAVLGSVAEMSRSRPLYFLDSRTSAGTVAWEAASAAGLRSAQRDVFLDNDLAPEAILGQLRRLLDEAAVGGQAIGIGHLKPETLAVLEAEMPRIEGRQARFVFLGDLVR